MCIRIWFCAAACLTDRAVIPASPASGSYERPDRTSSRCDCDVCCRRRSVLAGVRPLHLPAYLRAMPLALRGGPASTKRAVIDTFITAQGATLSASARTAAPRELGTVCKGRGRDHKSESMCRRQLMGPNVDVRHAIRKCLFLARSAHNKLACHKVFEQKKTVFGGIRGWHRDLPPPPPPFRGREI
ncbi:uncharacterized protein LY79DRAFT_239408 [Colletotrichum navitas]|uniref:Secreted protein n=1 Tax=Colletotrichum navitas TaxID=681940 RepID=A0AAD8PY97_9PEZI|nr:uncharacterized protein LY79DRAFT_239408 [Colletotrichum navitas]KAK1589733.1 hypothetical protein LY79DRAFT_239408 [Colletotrichum navitas]